jgi:ATP-dependent Clp protease protease subunit
MSKIIQLLRNNANVPGLIKAVVDGDKADVFLKGVISADWGVGASDLREAFAQSEGRDVALRINSPGGDVFEGREMQAVIVGYKGKVTAIVEGIAASAATIVSMAANQTHMLRGSRYMIHNASTIAIGTRHDFKAVYDLLTGVDGELAAEYAKYSGQTEAQAAAWMDAETWFTADQALESGFVQQVLDNSKAEQVAAQVRAWNLSAYDNTPKDLLEPPAPAHPDPAAVRAANQRRLRLLQID